MTLFTRMDRRFDWFSATSLSRRLQILWHKGCSREHVLRITRLPTHHDMPCLRVEGRLVGDWVQVLQVEVERAQALSPALELDLSGVEFADSVALALLLEVARRGVKLVACSPLLTSLLESQAS